MAREALAKPPRKAKAKTKPPRHKEDGRPRRRTGRKDNAKRSRKA